MDKILCTALFQWKWDSILFIFGQKILAWCSIVLQEGFVQITVQKNVVFKWAIIQCKSRKLAQAYFCSHHTTTCSIPWAARVLSSRLSWCSTSCTDAAVSRYTWCSGAALFVSVWCGSRGGRVIRGMGTTLCPTCWHMFGLHAGFGKHQFTKPNQTTPCSPACLLQGGGFLRSLFNQKQVYTYVW